MLKDLFIWISLSIFFGMMVSGFARNWSGLETLAERLQVHVERLAEIQPARNYRHPESMGKAANFIEKSFNKFTHSIESQYFEVNGRTYRNLFASFGPDVGRRIIVGAHYDVCEDQPGADDNASGVAGLLELARLLGESPRFLPVRVDLAAYALEEPPFFKTPEMGSAHHVRWLQEQEAEVQAMICLEMIGYYHDEPGSQHFPTPLLKPFYPDSGSFIMVVSNLSNRTLGKSVRQALHTDGILEAKHLFAPAALAGVDYSDHYNFWKAGIPAVMITDTAFYRNPNYHETGDTPDTLDYQKMAALIRSLGEWLQTGEI